MMLSMGAILISFLSTLSLRRATAKAKANENRYKFLSTLSLRRATPTLHHILKLFPISIHALLAESDVFGFTWLASRSYFYPRSPCGERPGKHAQQPTQQDFYPRSPCGERPDTLTDDVSTGDFYPRSPCGERRTTIITIFIASKFLSTLSLRRATSFGNSCTQSVPISIHALLAESDLNLPSSPIDKNISIHALLAESDATSHDQEASSHGISIHALLAESDESQPPCVRPTTYFYPRSPCGERPQ